MCFDRPFGNELSPCYMWASYSPDLVFWGKAARLCTKANHFMMAIRWVQVQSRLKLTGMAEIYHTVSQTCNGFIYYLKACLLDLNDPSQVIGLHPRFYSLASIHMRCRAGS